VYRREFANVADLALRAGKYKIDAVFESLSIRIIEESELGKADFSERKFFNVNTPEDWRTAEEKL
jgi:molybdopterin-guanine dinucleotide biosynthesis protein A